MTSRRARVSVDGRPIRSTVTCVNDTSATISHGFDGSTWDIPADLVRIQRDWDAAEAACAAAAQGDDTDVLDAARARLQELTLAMYRHPWLDEMQREGRRYAADRALKDLARGAATA
jgi:hypothetical protein